MIAVIASMDEEFDLVKRSMTKVKEEKHGFLTCYKGLFHKKPVVVAKCQTGKVAMAMTAQIIIDAYTPTLLINTGVAGGLNPILSIGDVVVVSKAIQHDMDATGLGYKLGEIPDINKKVFDCVLGFESICAKYKNDHFNILFGTALTGDKMVTSKEEATYLRDTFGGDCVDMETAALSQVAYINNIPFAAIRGISDTANESASKDFRKNLEFASDNAGLVLLYSLNKLENY